jgi:arylsulfatase A-like enzyme
VTCRDSNLITRQCDVPVKADTTAPDRVTNRLGITGLFLLSAWCGIVAGLLEAGTLAVRKHTFDPNHLYGMSRHFPWLIPLADLCLFLVGGAIGCFVVLVTPRVGGWLVVRGLCGLVLWPMALVAFPQIYSLALLAVVLGVAIRLVPVVERKPRAFGQFVRYSVPILVALILILAAVPFLGDRIKRAHQAAQPLPPANSPNVLLIVLDSVAANHLSLHGYARETSLTLSELAERGVRFDAARSSSSWSLPTHATMFTGRWLHEISAGWLTPLDNKPPTLAEFFTSRGYATAGFVANTVYCATDSGLSRGFTRYHDFIFPALTFLKASVLINRVFSNIQADINLLEDTLELERIRPYTDWVWGKVGKDRKEAAVVNREFLDWLTDREQPGRPFFAFLNFFDAHYPYQVPEGRMHRFGSEPTNSRQRVLLYDWFQQCRTGISPAEIAFAVAAYDDCIGDLDEQLGRLIDELEARGILERTWLIVTSDHGESFGEHEKIFCHGTSLYQTELRVPLLIIPPGGAARAKVVNDTVSLRDLAATVVDVTGQRAGSPFPGHSLARFWDTRATEGLVSNTAHSEPDAMSASAAAELALASVPPSRDLLAMPKSSWPRGELTLGEWSYIRYEGEVHEELFHLGHDPREQFNRAIDPKAEATLVRMREALGRITNGPLLPLRFSP